jgi:hypothetical protein
MVNERDQFTEKVNALLDKPYGTIVYCWLRRCTSDYMEAEATARGIELEEIGSSDVSCKMFQLYQEWKMPGHKTWLCDSFGHAIQHRIHDEFDPYYKYSTFDA